jgi:hypothetical protein
VRHDEAQIIYVVTYVTVCYICRLLNFKHLSEREQKLAGMSLGWQTESALLPSKAKPIAVDSKSVCICIISNSIIGALD